MAFFRFTWCFHKVETWEARPAIACLLAAQTGAGRIDLSYFKTASMRYDPSSPWFSIFHQCHQASSKSWEEKCNRPGALFYPVLPWCRRSGQISGPAEKWTYSSYQVALYSNGGLRPRTSLNRGKEIIQGLDQFGGGAFSWPLPAHHCWH